MRLSLLIVLSVVLGLGIGMASAVAEFGVGNSRPTLATAGVPSLAPPKGPPPVVVVDEPSYAFPPMHQEEVGRHTFVIKNTGRGLLTLEKGTTSCKCTIANLSREKVPPGETAEVTLEWRPEGLAGDFARTATIKTNDPKRASVEFKIRGQIIPLYKLEPPHLLLDNLTQKESATREAKLLFYRDEPGEITGHSWGNEHTAEFFDVAYEPLPKAELDGAKATAGYKITIAVRPGMKEGQIVQPLTLNTSLKAKPQITLPIHGNIAAEIALYGPGNFNRQTNVLSFHEIPAGKSRSTKLLVSLVGPRRHDVQLKVARVVPEDLKVTVEKAIDFPTGSLRQYPISIHVPRTMKPVSFLGDKPEQMGLIVLETTHPEIKELKIPVWFAIVEKNAAEKKMVEKNAAEKKMVEKNAAEKKMVEKNAAEKKMVEKKMVEKNAAEKNKGAAATPSPRP